MTFLCSDKIASWRLSVNIKRFVFASYFCSEIIVVVEDRLFIFLDGLKLSPDLMEFLVWAKDLGNCCPSTDLSTYTVFTDFYASWLYFIVSLFSFLAKVIWSQTDSIVKFWTSANSHTVNEPALQRQISSEKRRLRMLWAENSCSSSVLYCFLPWLLKKRELCEITRKQNKHIWSFDLCITAFAVTR